MNKLTNEIEWGVDDIMADVKESIKIMGYGKKRMSKADAFFTAAAITVGVFALAYFGGRFICYLNEYACIF